MAKPKNIYASDRFDVTKVSVLFDMIPNKYDIGVIYVTLSLIVANDERRIVRFAMTQSLDIKTDPRAILIKLSDHSHNSESLYVMQSSRFEKYIKETRHYIYDLASYGKIHYSAYSNYYTALKSQIRSFCNEAEIFVQKYTEHEKDVVKDYSNQISALKSLILERGIDVPENLKYLFEGLDAEPKDNNAAVIIAD